MLKPQVDQQSSSLTTLQLLQEEATSFVKAKTGAYIIEKYPLFKQLNVIAQGDETAKSQMVQFINQRRADCDAMEKTIGECADVEQLTNLPFLARWVVSKMNELPDV